MTEKICPRCGKSFICQPENPTVCQCAGIHLTPAQREWVRGRYTDCLCRNCLLDIRNMSL